MQHKKFLKIQGRKGQQKLREKLGNIYFSHMKEIAKRRKKTMVNAKKKQIVVAVSGGFDPVHIGHVRLFQEAKKLGDRLVVILNNDHWLRKKKGAVFMDQKERKEVIEAFRFVDRVVVSAHAPNPRDMSVCNELRKLKPDVFANGGDRFSDNIPEVAVCRKMGCAMKFQVGRGGKVQSSSWLLSDYLKQCQALRGGAASAERKKSQSL